MSHIQRGGREFTVDLYSILTGSVRESTLRLADGDRIIVPPLGRTIAGQRAGAPARASYELPPGQSSIGVRNLMALAGGPEAAGEIINLSALRITANGQSRCNWRL